MMRLVRAAAAGRYAGVAATGFLVLASACAPADGTRAAGDAAGDPARPPARGAQVGAIAPELASHQLGGPRVSLSGLRGSPVLLNVWATWCHPCRDEIPVLEALHREHAAQGLKVVGVSIDDAGRTSDIGRFATEFGVTYSIWHDPDQHVMPTFSVIGVPTTFLIDRAGRLLWRKTGEVKAGDPGLAAALATTL